MNKIGIILTSIERPLALRRCLESIISVWQENWVLMVGLQDNYDSRSFEVVSEIIRLNPEKEIRLYDLEYDCGISVARNELINKATMWGYKYVLLTADSITFDESMKDINRSLLVLDEGYYNLIGLPLIGRIGWEAKLDLVTNPERAFELDFIEKNINEEVCLVGDVTFNLWPCDIVRNFWIANTDSIFKVPYDEQFIMAEHEDFFYRYKEAGYRVCCTNLCAGIYNKLENTPEYDKIRATNFRIGRQRLVNKYSLKHWICYKHLERTRL